MKKLKILLQSNYFYILVFLVLSFFIFFKTKVQQYTSEIPDDTKKITATIVTYKIDGNKLSLNLNEKENFVATYYIDTLEEKEYLQNNLKIGVKIIVEGEKQEVLDNTIPNTFNYKKYLYNKKIYFSFLITKLDLLESKIKSIYKIKNNVKQRIINLDNNPYLEAFILGDKSLMANDVQEIIKNNGVSHLFALSGMHLTFIYQFLDKLLKKLKLRKIFIYLFLLFYLALASFPVSFIRAILFTLFLDLNRSFSLNISKIKILFLVAIFLLFYNPFYIYDMGFIYTFVVTFSLLFCNDQLKQKNKFLQVALVSIITFLFSAPITIFTNYEINVLSFLNNIILVPFVSVIVFPLAMFTFCFSFFLPLFNFIIQILENINHFLSLFSLVLIVGKITIVDVIIYYVLLMSLLKIKLKFLYIIFILYLAILYHKEIFNNYSSVYYLDVGQGDSTLLVAPRNKEVILIDTGGKIEYKKEDWQLRKKEYNLAETILQFLKSKRIRKVDLLLLTHGDLDHIGYADYLTNNLKFNSVLINQGKINSYEQKIISKVSKVKYYNSKYFDYKNLPTKDYDDENDNSLISYFKIDKFQFLFMGDASKKVELDLINKFNLDIDFLKVGHHGSNTSSDEKFLNQINPKYAIISAGRNNRYHHPSEETIKALKNFKIDILNTQTDGTIEIRINKNKFNIIKTIS